MQSDSDIILCDFIFKVAVRKTRVRRSSPHSVYTSVRLVGITRWTHPTSDIHGRIWPLSTSAKKSCVCVRLAIASASGRGKFTSPGAEPRIPGGASGAEPRGFFFASRGLPGVVSGNHTTHSARTEHWMPPSSTALSGECCGRSAALSAQCTRVL